MHADGRMMRRPACHRFAAEYDLEIITTAQLVEYRKVMQGGMSPPVPITTPLEASRLISEATDRRHMTRALALAETGESTTPPNPWVGCVLVSASNDVIIGEGFHSVAGGPHAEIVALKDARSTPEGAAAVVGCTAYVTLEPCHHFGRTGPCDRTLIDAGVARVVVGMLDPDPRVSGMGCANLRAAGVEVLTGVLASVRLLHCPAPQKAVCSFRLLLTVYYKIVFLLAYLVGALLLRH